MNDTGLIQDFLDGSLNSSQEEELFGKLSSNEELRGELKQFIAMDNVFNKKLSTMVPSASSTMSIFSNLGINNAPAAASVEPVKSFWGKYSTGIYSGLSAAVITAAIFLFGFGSRIFDNSNVNDNFAGIHYLNDKSNTNEIIKMEIPVTESYTGKSGQQNVINDNELQRLLAELKKLKEAQKSADIPKIADNDIIEIKEIENIESVTLTYSKPEMNNYDNILNNSTPEVQTPGNLVDINGQLYQPFSFSNNDLGIVINLKGGQYWLYEKSQISRSTIPDFYNTGISVGYKLSEDFIIMADLRNEHYYQEFKGKDNAGNNYLYRQYPNYLTLSAGFRWNFLKVDNFNLFNETMLGGTQTGQVGRIALGVEYSPQSNFAFTLGVESSALRYTHQDNTYFSPKFGVIYGFSLKF